jgi:hypothetical protein
MTAPPSTTILERLKAALAGCPACDEADLDVHPPLSDEEIAEYAARHGIDEVGLSSDDVAALRAADERSGTRSTFLRTERLAAMRRGASSAPPLTSAEKIAAIRQNAERKAWTRLVRAVEGRWREDLQGAAQVDYQNEIAAALNDLRARGVDVEGLVTG